MVAAFRRWTAGRDARSYQILFLGALLATGAWFRDFSIEPAQVLLTFASGLATQLFYIRALSLRGIGVSSAAITWGSKIKRSISTCRLVSWNGRILMSS